jgi:uncharacterized protein YjbJ (UPF0337 family)
MVNIFHEKTVGKIRESVGKIFERHLDELLTFAEKLAGKITDTVYTNTAKVVSYDTIGHVRFLENMFKVNCVCIDSRCNRIYRHDLDINAPSILLLEVNNRFEILGRINNKTNIARLLDTKRLISMLQKR